MINVYKPEGMLSSNIQNRELTSNRAGLEKAMAMGAILEGTVVLCDSDMNLHVDLHGITGIIPRSEVVYSKNGEDIKDIAIITRVGKPVCFKVMGIAEQDGKTVALLSRREAQIECLRNYISDLIPGDIIQAKVTHLENFGAFVDIGCGIVSLLTVDCISVSRISHPKDRLFCGMQLYTVVKNIDESNGRIFVSMRELLGTWEENANLYSPGQTVAGIIRSIESYGVFVELMPNLAGLAELRDDFSLSDQSPLTSSSGKKSAFCDENLIGRFAAVYIKSIIPERMKIKLVLIDSYKGEHAQSKLKYFIDCENVTHIDSWQYSPEYSGKKIETVF